MTLPDVCGPVSPHITMLSFILRERGIGWQSGHPTLLSVIQWELWFESQRYILCGWFKRELAGREAITATQPAIYQWNWGCRIGQHCSLWIELKCGLSKSDTLLREQGVLVSKHTHTNQHSQPCAYAYHTEYLSSNKYLSSYIVCWRTTTVNTAWANIGNESERLRKCELKSDMKALTHKTNLTNLYDLTFLANRSGTHTLMHPPTCLCTWHRCPNTTRKAAQRYYL